MKKKEKKNVDNEKKKNTNKHLFLTVIAVNH